MDISENNNETRIKSSGHSREADKGIVEAIEASTNDLYYRYSPYIEFLNEIADTDSSIISLPCKMSVLCPEINYEDDFGIEFDSHIVFFSLNTKGQEPEYYILTPFGLRNLIIDKEFFSNLNESIANEPIYRAEYTIEDGKPLYKEYIDMLFSESREKLVKGGFLIFDPEKPSINSSEALEIGNIKISFSIVEGKLAKHILEEKRKEIKERRERVVKGFASTKIVFQ